MAEAKRLSNGTNHQETHGITKISVCGYKSIKDECSIDIYPLTILAGANSSGKSSIIQPLLLMKQTLEAPYDPGALLLDGPHVKFTSVDQLLSRQLKNELGDRFSVEIEVEKEFSVRNTFAKDRKKAIDIVETQYRKGDYVQTISPKMSEHEIKSMLPDSGSSSSMHRRLYGDENTNYRWAVVRDRCYLQFQLQIESAGEKWTTATDTIDNVYILRQYIRSIIHVPGLRGNPKRTYQVTAVSDFFPGTFENYVASLIANWQDEESPKLQKLGESLKALGLAENVEVKKVDDTQVEVQVGHRRNNTTDMTSIADVGFGVSQTLPVIVALITANPLQLVYIEQPELHLHPRAQAALADIVVEAVNRGVRVVLETHSDLFLRRIQSLVAEDKLAHDQVKLHWFSKDEDGFTQVSTANLDADGSFGDWPEDFGDVDLQEESRYLDAADKKLAQKSHGQ
jgi:predicted ATPase